MISLEQAEQQYRESLHQSTNGEDPPLEPGLHDASTTTDSIVNIESFSDVNDPQQRLLRMARGDVNSIRSSLKSTFDQQESLQARISLHSQRLSMLIAEDHKRLSQRWSRPLDADFSLNDNSHHGKQTSFARQEKTAYGEPVLDSFSNDPEQQTIYVNFRNWLLMQPWSQQDGILIALRSAMHSDRTSPGRSKIVDHDIKGLTFGHGRVEEAMTFHGSAKSHILNESNVVPFKVAGLPTHPRINLHSAAKSITALPIKQSDGHDHRRSRSHDVSSSGTRGFETSSAKPVPGSHHIRAPTPQHFLIPSASTNVRQFSFGHLFPYKSTQDFSEHYYTPDSSESRLMPQPLSPGGSTPRKVKRYSVLFGSGHDEQEHEPDNMLQNTRAGINAGDNRQLPGTSEVDRFLLDSYKTFWEI